MKFLLKFFFSLLKFGGKQTHKLRIPDESTQLAFVRQSPNLMMMVMMMMMMMMVVMMMMMMIMMMLMMVVIIILVVVYYLSKL